MPAPKLKLVRVCRGNYGYDLDGRPVGRIRKIDACLWWAQTKGESGHFDSLRDAKAFIQQQWQKGE